MKQIQLLIQELGKVSGLPVGKAKEGEYLTCEYASCYGGYRLIIVNSVGGGHSGAFGKSGCEARMSKKLFILYLESLITGIKYGNLSITNQ